MTDKELLRIVTGFRRGILGRRKPLKMCYAICGPLHSYLKITGFETTLTEGKIKLDSHNEGITINHFWLTLKDGRIVDPTASQFNGFCSYPDLPAVYLGAKPDYYIVKKSKKKKA